MQIQQAVRKTSPAEERLRFLLIAAMQGDLRPEVLEAGLSGLGMPAWMVELFRDATSGRTTPTTIFYPRGRSFRVDPLSSLLKTMMQHLGLSIYDWGEVIEWRIPERGVRALIRAFSERPRYGSYEIVPYEDCD